MLDEFPDLVEDEKIFSNFFEQMFVLERANAKFTDEYREYRSEISSSRLLDYIVDAKLDLVVSSPKSGDMSPVNVPKYRSSFTHSKKVQRDVRVHNEKFQKKNYEHPSKKPYFKKNYSINRDKQGN